MIRRNLWPVVALVAPGTDIAHRTAFEMAPAEKGTIFLSAPYPRRFTLPGLQIRLIRGPGPLDGDQPFLQGLFLASRPRAFLEVLMPTRVSAGVTRGLPAQIVEEKLEQLLFDGKIPASRPADATDVLATYRIVGSRTFTGRSVQAFGSYELFEAALRGAHTDMLTARPDKRPGLFKQIANSAGNTLFVDSSLVRGTLRHGFERARSLPTAFARAAMLMFVLAQVHPFDDGSGRIARAFMNAELIAAQERRALVPTVIRSDYLSALKAMTFSSVAQPLIETLDRAQEYSQRIDFTSYDHAVAVVKATNAFEEPLDGGPRPRLP